jgi:hypothetical protein
MLASCLAVRSRKDSDQWSKVVKVLILVGFNSKCSTRITSTTHWRNSAVEIVSRSFMLHSCIHCCDFQT